ncbi:transglutaminase domain-containing protein [Candidatus Bathyarchaeota archaeon]|nr:transglutaminase domain-containing protein [Candidatus Bathyarchaeota archaeon]
MKLSHRLLLALVIVLVTVSPAHAAAADKYRYTLGYTFENRGTEAMVLLKEDLAVPYFMDTEWQAVEVEETSHPLGETLTDDDGNRYAVVGVPLTLGAGESVEFTVSYLIESREKPRPEIDATAAEAYDSLPNELVERYTGSSETFMSDDPQVAGLAEEIASGESTVLGAVAEMIEWLGDNTEYCNYEVPRYPNVTAQEGLGDCDDQSILLISMCRSLGIPAYLQVGIIIHPNIVDSSDSWDGHLSSTREGVGWHGWAMIYVPPWGWVPVDLTLVQSDDGLEVIRSAPEYQSYIIPAFNVSEQAYIGDTLRTRERIIQSELYIVMTDKGESVYSGGLGGEIYLVAGLGLAVTAAIVLMFVSSRRTVDI